jgi:hypothetical protein
MALDAPPMQLPSPRRSACALCVVVLLALAAVGAPAASAVQLKTGESSALSELTQGGEEQTTSTATTAATTGTSEPHNSSSTLVVVMGAAIVLLSGIGFVIVRDARRAAPAGELDLAQRSTARYSEAAMRKRRAKAKAARQQRKRNR